MEGEWCSDLNFPNGIKIVVVVNFISATITLETNEDVIVTSVLVCHLGDSYVFPQPNLITLNFCTKED